MAGLYTASGVPELRSHGSSDAIRQEFYAIERAFAQLPSTIADAGGTGFYNATLNNSTIRGSTIEGGMTGTQEAPTTVITSGIAIALGTVGSAFSPTFNGYALEEQADQRIGFRRGMNSILSMTPRYDVIVGPLGPRPTNTEGGFLRMTPISGAPAGVPEPIVTTVSLAYDSSGHRLWVYSNGWRSVALA